MKNNVLILCPSWEERSWLGFERNCCELQINKIVVIKKFNQTNLSIIDDCVEQIKSYCDHKSIEFVVYEWFDDPVKTYSLINSLLESISDNDFFHLDITTMPRDIIWTLLSVFNQRDNSVEIRYYQPESYCDTWLSKEPFSPRLLLKHSGLIEFGKQTCVVIITGFDVDRTKLIVTKFEPQKVVLCSQTGTQYKNETRNSKSIHEKVCRDLGVTDVDHKEIDSYAEDFGKNAISEIVKSLLQSYNVILTSLGPKPSAVAAYLTYIEYPMIALCYVPCREYNKHYCMGLRQLYKFKFK
jgi:hypothetical protein